MLCKHCGFAATAKGKDMSRETFLTACQYAYDNGSTIFIGGGEPTLHPLLFDFLGIALAHCDSEIGVGIVTNGKLEQPARQLARMARNGTIHADLSQDRWHEPISKSVIDAFTKPERPSYAPDNNDRRGIRGANGRIFGAGRGKKIPGAVDQCFCDDLIVEPDGTLWGCGCKSQQFGTIDAPNIPSDYHEGECWEYQKKELERNPS
jgi:hypothetical protein